MAGRSSPPLPIRRDLVGTGKIVQRLLERIARSSKAAGVLSHADLAEFQQAQTNAELIAELISTRLDELQALAEGISSGTITIETAASSSETTVTAGVESIRTVALATGALNFDGNAVTQTGRRFTFRKPVFIDWHVPTGAINGVNTSFTMSAAPSPTASTVFLVGGQGWVLGAGLASVTGAVVVTSRPPQTGQTVLASGRQD